MYLNNNLFFHTSIAAFFIVFGVIYKNSAPHLDKKKRYDTIAKTSGSIFFIAGWLYMIYSLSKGGKRNSLFYVIPCSIILGSVIAKNIIKDNNKQISIIFPILFAAGWISLGFLVSEHLPGMARYIGLIGSIFVLVSMMYALPIQRKKFMVDGPGMPLFVIAWFIIIVSNSYRPTI